MTWFKTSDADRKRTERTHHRWARTLTLALALVSGTACAGEDLPDEADEATTLAQLSECERTRNQLRWFFWWLQLPECTTPVSPPPATREPTTPTEPITRPVTPVTPPVTREPVEKPIVRPRQPADGSTGDTGFPTLGTDVIDVTHYDLDFRWNPDDATLKARVVISLTTHDTLDGIPLDFGRQLQITGLHVSVSGAAAQPATIHQAQEKLIVPLPAAVPADTKVAITVLYEGMPEPVVSAAPIAVGWSVYDDGDVGTLSEPDAAHQWFPANDHPTDKATFRTKITVPPDRVAVGNGVQQGEPIQNADGTVSWTWLMDAPMAPYLTLVSIDRFSVLDQGTAAGVPLRNYVPRGQEHIYTEALAQQPAMIEYLVERLGPYPFAEYGAVVSEGADVALETQGRSLFQGNSARNVGTVIHELAHHWFGNSVSLTRWQEDIWWVEGFARFSEWLWTEETEGPTAYRGRGEAAYRDLSRRRHPSLGRPDVFDLFDEGIYEGGAMVFYQLRNELGDEAFWGAIRAFCGRYRHQNATSEDLLAVFSEFAGRDVRGSVESWFFGSRIPSLNF
jgi:aminopeptidase N